MYKLARMHKTLHTQLGSSGLSYNFEHLQASPRALSNNSWTRRGTGQTVMRDTVHKIDAKQSGKKIPVRRFRAICDPAQAIP